MSKNEDPIDPIDPKDRAEIPERPYWHPSSADQLRTSGNLVLETGPNTSWAFPFAHLIRFDWAKRWIHSPWAISERTPKIPVGTIRLQFPTATVTADTYVAEKIANSILLRNTLVLYRSGAYLSEGDGERLHYDYGHSTPSDKRGVCHCEATGIIKVTQ
jgi:hypothetical protein